MLPFCLGQILHPDTLPLLQRDLHHLFLDPTLGTIPAFPLLEPTHPELITLTTIPIDIHPQHQHHQTRRDADQIQTRQTLARGQTDDDNGNGQPEEQPWPFPQALPGYGFVDVSYGDETHADKRDAQASAVIPPQALLDRRQRLCGVQVSQSRRVCISTVVRQHQSRERRGREHIAHDERHMAEQPDHGTYVVASDRVHVQVVGVDLEVDPVEGEGLDEAEDGLAEEGVYAEGGFRLEDDREDGVAEDEGHEGIGAFGFVFDVDGGVEFEVSVSEGDLSALYH